MGAGAEEAMAPLKIWRRERKKREGKDGGKEKKEGE